MFGFTHGWNQAEKIWPYKEKPSVKTEGFRHFGLFTNGLRRGVKSLPLDRRRRLAANVVHHAGDAVHFVDDAVGDAAEEVIR